MKPTQVLYKIFTLILTCMFGLIGGGFAAGFCKGVEDEKMFCFSLVIAGIAAGAGFSYLLCYGLPRISLKKSDSK
jgi:hypothetical protein